MKKLSTSRVDILEQIQKAKDSELEKHNRLLNEQEQRLQSELNTVLSITDNFTNELKSRSGLTKKLFLVRSWTVGITTACILSAIVVTGVMFWWATGKLADIQSEITRLNMHKESVSKLERMIAEGKIELWEQNGKTYLINKNPKAEALKAEQKYHAWEF